jgi:hypothetical protein
MSRYFTGVFFAVRFSTNAIADEHAIAIKRGFMALGERGGHPAPQRAPSAGAHPNGTR